MLKAEDNELLTRVGPGTPMGDLMRWYWHPIAAAVELDTEPTKAVTILGEELVLYKDLSGTLGLIEKHCAHRRMGMIFGIPEENGLRCPYHGWLFDEQGQCLETPLEPVGSTFAGRVKMESYPVREMGGLIWAYLGKQPAPEIPNWDLFVWPNAIRQIGTCILPCNWLQCQENALDLYHNTYLHGYWFKYILEKEGLLEERAADRTTHRAFTSMRSVIDNCDHRVEQYGVQKYTTRRGDPSGRVSHGPYVIFPYYTRPGGGGIRTEFQIRVPMDDTHTYHVNYQIYVAPPGIEAPKQDTIPHYEVPLVDERGKPILDFVLAQDLAAWYSQGTIADRTKEHLGKTDEGVIMFRQLLKDQVAAVQRGERPMNVFYGDEAPACINLDPPLNATNPLDVVVGTNSGQFRSLYHKGYWRDDGDRYGPLVPQVNAMMQQIEDLAAQRAAASEESPEAALTPR